MNRHTCPRCGQHAYYPDWRGGYSYCGVCDYTSWTKNLEEWK